MSLHTYCYFFAKNAIIYLTFGTELKEGLSSNENKEKIENLWLCTLSSAGLTVMMMRGAGK